jgi:hypothetical protein
MNKNKYHKLAFLTFGLALSLAALKDNPLHAAPFTWLND